MSISGCVTFASGLFQCSLSIIPLKKGFLHLPQVKLFQFLAGKFVHSYTLYLLQLATIITLYSFTFVTLYYVTIIS